MITLCCEDRYGAFWLARFLKARGPSRLLVIDPGSLQVNRRQASSQPDEVRRQDAVTNADRLVPGEPHVWSLVATPSIDEEDFGARAVSAPAGPQSNCAHQPDQGALFRQGIHGIKVHSNTKPWRSIKLA